MASGSGAPPGSRYVDQRHFVVAASLSDLRGPVRGVVTLDRWLQIVRGGVGKEHRAGGVHQAPPALVATRRWCGVPWQERVGVGRPG